MAYGFRGHIEANVLTSFRLISNFSLYARALIDFSWKSKNLGGNSLVRGGDSCGHVSDSHGLGGDNSVHGGKVEKMLFIIFWNIKSL